MDNDQEDLKTTLLDAGWYEGRSIKKEIANTLLYEIFPTKIQNFFSEFGDLKIHAENKTETMIIDTSYLSNKDALDYQSSNIYKLHNKVDLSENRSLNYYYSTLIGIQLYPVAELIEQSNVFMDENGNFYTIDSLPQLSWISNETFDALTKITYGSKDIPIFNEHKMKWMAPVEKELNHILPVNPILKNNPWEK